MRFPLRISADKGAETLRTASGWASALLLVGMSACYAGRFDGCAAVTVVPAWAWLLLGIRLLHLAWRRMRRAAAVSLLLLWTGYFGAFVDEVPGMARSIRAALAGPARSDAAESGGWRALRVATLNCHRGSEAAMAESSAARPDIILLQEAPPRERVEWYGRRLFGGEAGIAWAGDVAILARGRITSVFVSPGGWLVETGVQFASGARVRVIALHLTAAETCLDLTSPACWKAHAANRRLRRQQLAIVEERVRRLPASLPLIVGGDFNTPAGDAVFRVLAPRLTDSFRRAGRGWGDTYHSRMPVHRIDQIWVSDRFRPVRVEASTVPNTDHRMVSGVLCYRPRL